MNELPEEVLRTIGNTELERAAIKVLYTNWRNETAVRRIIPLNFYFGSTEYHKEEQWLLKVYDLDKNDFRDYALKDIDWNAD